MKLFLVMLDIPYDISEPCGIFSTPQRAEAFIQKAREGKIPSLIHSDGYLRIAEFTLDSEAQ